MSDRDHRALLLEVLGELDDVSRRILERDAAEGGTAPDGPLARELGLDPTELCRLRIAARTDVELCLGQPWEDLLEDAGYSLRLSAMSPTELTAERDAGDWRVLSEVQRRSVQQELDRRLSDDQPRTPGSSGWRRWAIFGVAASAAAALALWKWGPTGSVKVDMTALANPPRGDELRYFTQELGLETYQIPLGFGLKGDPQGEVPGMAAEAWLPIGREAESRRVERAFERSGEILRGGRFTLCFRATTEVSALSIWALEDGTLEWVYPQPGDPPKRFAANEIHVLPRELMVLQADDPGTPSLDYDPGFTVPFGQERILVLLALRSEPIDGESLSTFQSALAQRSAADSSQVGALAQAADALRRRGFVLRQFEVRVE